MNKRVATVLLAIFGLAAAAGIGLAANEVTGDSVGLSADPLEAGDTLAPPAGGRGEPLRSRERTSDSQRGAAGQDPPATTPEPFDDNGGDRSGSDDSSGPGSGSDDSSGPGSGSDDD
jgi:hypothetical protein